MRTETCIIDRVISSNEEVFVKRKKEDTIYYFVVNIDCRRFSSYTVGHESPTRRNRVN